MSELQSLSLYSNKGLVKSFGVFLKHSDNKPKIFDDICTLWLKDSRDKVCTLHIKTRKAAGKEYQNTNTYVSFYKNKIVKVYIKKPRGGK
jgi:hypothetical protein